MNKFVFVGLFSALFAVAFSALSQYRPAPEGHPGYCFSNDTGAIEKPGDVDLPEKCARATCNEDHSITVATCGVIAVPPEYELSEINYTKQYPDCCPTPKLKGN